MKRKLGGEKLSNVFFPLSPCLFCSHPTPPSDPLYQHPPPPTHCSVNGWNGCKSKRSLNAEHWTAALTRFSLCHFLSLAAFSFTLLPSNPHHHPLPLLGAVSCRQPPACLSSDLSAPLYVSRKLQMPVSRRLHPSWRQLISRHAAASTHPGSSLQCPAARPSPRQRRVSHLQALKDSTWVFSLHCCL